ncbi:hypothetical protein V1519DRAFT_301795 [Lipomyces tetrasporus]
MGGSHGTRNTEHGMAISTELRVTRTAGYFCFLCLSSDYISPTCFCCCCCSHFIFPRSQNTVHQLASSTMAQQKRQQKPPRQQPPLPFWNSGSVQISQRLWLPSSSCHAEKWGSEPVARGWASCLRWSSTTEVK